jgi:hypothetical protein
MAEEEEIKQGCIIKLLVGPNTLSAAHYPSFFIVDKRSSFYLYIIDLWKKNPYHSACSTV